MQEVPDIGEKWEALQRGGPNGFFMIVLAFAWWVEAMDGDMDDAGLRDALDDITWVSNCIAASIPPMANQLIGQKRARDDRSDTSTRKRYAF